MSVQKMPRCASQQILWPMSQLGQSRPGRARIRSSYVCYAPKSGSHIRVLASAMTDYGGLICRHLVRVLEQRIWQPIPDGDSPHAAACRSLAARWPLVRPGWRAGPLPPGNPGAWTATRRAREALWLPLCGCPVLRIGRAVALRWRWVRKSGWMLSGCPPGGSLTHGRASALVAWSTSILVFCAHVGPSSPPRLRLPLWPLGRRRLQRL